MQGIGSSWARTWLRMETMGTKRLLEPIREGSSSLLHGQNALARCSHEHHRRSGTRFHEAFHREVELRSTWSSTEEFEAISGPLPTAGNDQFTHKRMLSERSPRLNGQISRLSSPCGRIVYYSGVRMGDKYGEKIYFPGELVFCHHLCGEGLPRE
jgi:hypothetical protein